MARFAAAMAVLFVAAAGFHGWRAAFPVTGDESTPLRHLVFVAINLLAAAGVARRSSWFLVLFPLLIGQQIASHGGLAWRLWISRGEVDWISLAIVFLLPLTWLVLWRERRNVARGRSTTIAA